MIAAEASEKAIPGDRTNDPPPPEQRPERVCPNCGGALYESRCKLLCPNRACGYYMSCSDFY